MPADHNEPKVNEQGKESNSVSKRSTKGKLSPNSTVVVHNNAATKPNNNLSSTCVGNSQSTHVAGESMAEGTHLQLIHAQLVNGDQHLHTISDITALGKESSNEKESSQEAMDVSQKPSSEDALALSTAKELAWALIPGAELYDAAVAFGRGDISEGLTHTAFAALDFLPPAKAYKLGKVSAKVAFAAGKKKVAKEVLKQSSKAAKQAVKKGLRKGIKKKS